MENLSIRDFIIDVNEVSTKVEEKSRKKSSIEFKLLVETETDFVISRATAKTEKELVYFLGKDLFYIKDNKSGTVTILDRDNIKKEFGLFFKGYQYDITFSKVAWIKDINKERLINTISDESSKLLIKHGLHRYTDSYAKETVCEFLRKNPKLIKKLLAEIKYDPYFYGCVFAVNELVDYNNAIYLIDIQKDFKFYWNYEVEEQFKQLLNSKIFDTNSLLKYITYELRSQGKVEINGSILSLLRDYVYMQIDMYGKVKDKYSKHLETDHDKMTMKYNLWKKYKNDEKVLLNSELHKSLEFSDKKYSIILPANTSDLVDEGINLSHCVASYINKVVNDETIILFMRDNLNIDEALITIEVNNNEVKQVRGFGNRDPEKDEIKFVKKWAKENKLKYIIK